MRTALVLLFSLFVTSCALLPGQIPNSYGEYDVSFLNKEMRGRYSRLFPRECIDLSYKVGEVALISPERLWKQCVALLPHYFEKKELAIKNERNQRLQELESLGEEARRQKEEFVKSDQFPEAVFNTAGLDQAFAKDCYKKGGMSFSEYQQYLNQSEAYVKQLTKSSYDYSRTKHWRAYNENYVLKGEKAGNWMCEHYREIPEIYKRQLQQYEALAEKFRR